MTLIPGSCNSVESPIRSLCSWDRLLIQKFRSCVSRQDTWHLTRHACACDALAKSAHTFRRKLITKKKKTDGEKKTFKVKNYLFDRIFSMLLQLSGDMNPILLSSTLYKRTETRKDEDWFKYIVHRIFTSLISLPFIDTSTQAWRNPRRSWVLDTSDDRVHL